MIRPNIIRTLAYLPLLLSIYLSPPHDPLVSGHETVSDAVQVR